MSTYTFSQLQQLWVSAGGNPQTSNIAAAVAMAESGGNPNATGPVGERGLWQIALSHGSLSTYDPTANARAAIQISNNGSNWRPWCTAYTDGACGTNGGTYSPASGSPSGRILTGSGSGSATGGPPPGGGATDTGVVSGLLSGSVFDPATWLHMMDVVLNNLFYAAVTLLGGFMMAVGAYILIRESPVAATTAGTISAARKVARI